MLLLQYPLHVCLGVVVALCLFVYSTAQLDTGNMRDLGYPEPNWYPKIQGNASAKVIEVKPLTQHWGTIEPYSVGNASLCKWFPADGGVGRGSCKTDLSWIHSAVGLSKAVFDDPVVNYILRFQVQGACYRSTQYSDNDASQYCAPWWLDPGTDTKINSTHICYEITQMVFDPLQNAMVQKQYGCAHKAPFEGTDIYVPVTLAAPPAAAPVADALTGGNGTVATNETAPVAGAVNATAPLAAGPVAAVGPDAAVGPPAASAPVLAEAGAAASTPVVASVPGAAAAPPPGGSGTTSIVGAVPARRLAQTTSAPATIPTAAAPPPPVAAGAQSPASAEVAASFPTAADDASNVQTTAAVQGGNVIATRADFFSDTAVYDSQGLEFYEIRKAWYDCHIYTAPYTEGRDTCYNEAFGKSFGLNANILKQMISVMQQDIPQCSANFEANAATQGTIGNQAWCEIDTSSWIQDNVLPLYDLTGTPAMPQSLDPTITMPPPPPPPDPPLPSAPFAPPLAESEAVEDVFATPRASGNVSDVVTPFPPSGSDAPITAGTWSMTGSTVAALLLLTYALV